MDATTLWPSYAPAHRRYAATLVDVLDASNAVVAFDLSDSLTLTITPNSNPDPNNPFPLSCLS